MKTQAKTNLLKLVLVVFAVILIAVPLSYASDTNWAAHPTSIKTGGTDGTNEVFGTPPNAFDENDSTYYGGDNFPELESTTTWVESNFSTPRNINRIKTILQTFLSGSYIISAYYSGNWHTVSAGTTNAYSQSDTTIIDLTNLSLNEVTKVKISTTSPAFQSGYGWISWAFVYELSAYGPDYVDIGLRAYDGNNIVKVICEPPGSLTSPLRIRKGSTTYGIPLVDSSSSMASKIRVKTNSGIKFLAKGLANLAKLPNTTHTYTKNYNGSNLDTSDGSSSIDENFTTRFGYQNSGGDSPSVREITVISEHAFAQPSTLNQIVYRMYADARANGKYIRNHNIEMYAQYYDTDWHDVPGSRYSAGGGEGEAKYDSGTVTYSGVLNNVTKVRAYCHAYSQVTGGEAEANSEAWIYEIQAW